jgi:ATP-dependent RNA helicase DeaD
LFINVGKSQNVRPGDIVGAIAGETGLKGSSIGQIDIFDRYTFVNVPNEKAQDVIKIMNNNTIKGLQISVEVAGAK